MFSQLSEKEWVRTEELSKALSIFFHRQGVPDAEVLCKAGLQWGCLKSLTINGKIHYRLLGTDGQPEADPSAYLATAADESLLVDLEKIPFETLELLVDISDMRMSGLHLTASPSIKRQAENGGQFLRGQYFLG